MKYAPGKQLVTFHVRLGNKVGYFCCAFVPTPCLESACTRRSLRLLLSAAPKHAEYKTESVDEAKRADVINSAFIRVRLCTPQLCSLMQACQAALTLSLFTPTPQCLHAAHQLSASPKIDAETIDKLLAPEAEPEVRNSSFALFFTTN
jgi:hypothetical protein